MSNIFDIKSNNSIKQKIVKMLLQEKYISNLPEKISKISFMLLDKKNRPFYNPFKEIFKDKYNDLKNEIDKIIDSEDSPFLKGKKVIELIKKNNLYSIDNLEHINNIQKMFYLTSDISIKTNDTKINELYANVFKDLYDTTYNILSKYIDYNTFINFKENFYNLFVKYASLDMNNTLSFEINAIIRKIEKKYNIKIEKDDVKTLKNNIEDLYEKNQFITEKIIQNKLKFSYKDKQYKKLFTKLPIYLRMGVTSNNSKLEMVHKLTNYSIDEINRFNIELFLYDSGLVDDISDETKKYLSRMLSFAKLMKNPKFLKYIYYYGLDEIDTIISLSKKLNIKKDKHFEIKIKKHLLPKIYKFIENNEIEDSLISSKYYTKYYSKTFNLNKYFNFLIEDIQKTTKEKVLDFNIIDIEESPILNNYILESVDNENVGTYISYRLNEILGKDNIINLINNEIVNFDSVYDKLSVFISFIEKNTKKFSNDQKNKEKIKIINILNKLKNYIENDMKFIKNSNKIEKLVEDLINKSINMDFHNIANSVNNIIDNYNKEYVNIVNDIKDPSEKEKFIKNKINKILNILDSIEDKNEYIELLKNAISSDNLDNIEINLKKIFNKLNILYKDSNILNNIDKVILELKDQDSNILNMNKLIDIHFMLNSEQYIPKIDLSLSERELNNIDKEYYKVINSIYDNIEYISDKHQFLKDLSLYINDIYFSKLFNKLTENSESISLNEREFIENYLKDNFDLHIDKKLYNSDLLNMLNRLINENKRLEYLKNLFTNRMLDENYPKEKDFIEKLNNKTELYKNDDKNYMSLFISKMVNDYIHNINKINIKKREIRLINSIESLYNDFKITSGLYKIKEPYFNILKVLKSEIKYGIIDFKYKEDLTKFYEKVSYFHINNNESFIFKNILNRFYKYYDDIKDFLNFSDNFIKNNIIHLPILIKYNDNYKKNSDIIKLKNILSDNFDSNKLKNISKNLYNSFSFNFKISYFYKNYTKNNFFILDNKSNELSILKKDLNNIPFTNKYYLLYKHNLFNYYNFSRNWDNLQFNDDTKSFKLSLKKFIENKIYKEKNIVKLNKLSSNVNIRKILYSRILKLNNENKDKLIDIIDKNKEFTKILKQLKDKKDDSLFLINIHNNLYNRTDIVIDKRLKNINNLVDFFDIDKNNIDSIKNIYIYNKILNKPFKLYSKEEIKNNLQNIIKDLIKDDINFYIDIMKENNYLLNKISYIKKKIEEKKKVIIEHIDKKVIEEKYENRSNLNIIKYNLLKEIKKSSEISYSVFSNKDKYIPTFSQFDEGSKFIYFIDKNKNINVKYIDQKYGLTKIYGEDGLEKVYDIEDYNNIFECSRDNSLYNSIHSLEESLKADNIIIKSKVDYLNIKLNSVIKKIKEEINKITSIDQQENNIISNEQSIKK